MSQASEVVLSGCSAGGLGIYLGVDQMTAMIKKSNKNIRVSALSDSGFFLDHTGDNVFSKPRKGMTAFEAIIDGVLDYSTTMKNVYRFMNLSAGANPLCVAAEMAKDSSIKSPRDTVGCMFAQNLVQHIQTPLFAVQVHLCHLQISPYV
jgi:Pectinacetylesterase